MGVEKLLGDNPKEMDTAWSTFIAMAHLADEVPIESRQAVLDGGFTFWVQCESRKKKKTIWRTRRSGAPYPTCGPSSRACTLCGPFSCFSPSQRCLSRCRACAPSSVHNTLAHTSATSPSGSNAGTPGPTNAMQVSQGAVDVDGRFLKQMLQQFPQVDSPVRCSSLWYSWCRLEAP